MGTGAAAVPEITVNTDGERFPQPAEAGKPQCDYEEVLDGIADVSACTCPLQLGQEYNFTYCEELAAIDFTPKLTAERQLNVGSYDTLGSCPNGGIGGPNCCSFSENGENYCFVVPNNLPWDGTLLNSGLAANATINTEAQYAGCQGGTQTVPYTNPPQTWCTNADNFWSLTAAANPTRAATRPNATMYVYDIPRESDTSAPRVTEQSPGNFTGGLNVSIYLAQETNPTAANPTLPPLGPDGFGLKFPERQPLGEYTWAFKQMHGKGFSCVNARFQVLSSSEDANLSRLGVPTLPERWQVGVFKKSETCPGAGRQYPTLLRFAGNRNHTLYDWHDIRVTGLGIKLYDAADVTGANGENRVKIAAIPRSSYADGPAPRYTYQQPYTISGIPQAATLFTGTLEQYQNETTIDFLYIGVKGINQQGCNTMDTSCFFNQFPEGRNAIDYSPNFLFGNDVFHSGSPGIDLTHSTWNPLNYTYGTGAALRMGSGGAHKQFVMPCNAQQSTDVWITGRNC